MTSPQTINPLTPNDMAVLDALQSGADFGLNHCVNVDDMLNCDNNDGRGQILDPTTNNYSCGECAADEAPLFNPSIQTFECGVCPANTSPVMILGIGMDGAPGVACTADCPGGQLASCLKNPDSAKGTNANCGGTVCQAGQTCTPDVDVNGATIGYYCSGTPTPGEACGLGTCPLGKVCDWGANPPACIDTPNPPPGGGTCGSATCSADQICDYGLNPPQCITNPNNPPPGDCTQNPSDPSCDYCTQYPDDPGCLDFCSQYPSDPSCSLDFCTQYPDDPSCTGFGGGGGGGGDVIGDGGGGNTGGGGGTVVLCEDWDGDFCWDEYNQEFGP